MDPEILEENEDDDVLHGILMEIMRGVECD